MAWYRRSKLGIDITSYHSKIISKFTSSSWNHQSVSITKVLSITDRSTFFGCSRSNYRYYHVDQRPNILSVIKSVGLGIGLYVCHGNVETIPYSKRKHFLLIPPCVERDIAVNEFEKMKASFEGKVLPRMHPDCVRVTMILKHVMRALQRESKKDEEVKLGVSHLEGLD